MQFNYNQQTAGAFGPLNNFRIQLFDSSAPITVTNFLRYVNNQNYNGSMIHRDAPDFVMQGGGYIPVFNPDTSYASMNSVVSYGAITNEYSSSRSNVRGTIAMAKLGGDPNSATNQWFVNLADNSSNLNYQNGGFTVFGQVVGEGMTLVDWVNNLPIYNAGSPFDQLPLYNYSGSLAYPNFVLVTSAAVVPTVEWKGGNSSGPTNWAVAANWSTSAAPNGAGVNLVVGSQVPANNIIDIISGGGRTVGNIYFSNATSTTIRSTGGYNLTLDNGSSASTVSVLGNQTISTPVILNSNTIFSGDGTLTLSGGVSSTKSMDLLSGIIIAKSIRVNTLTVGAGSTITIQAIPGGPLGEAIMPVPEPSTLLLLGIGVCGLLACGWRSWKA
jgi:cyclophilin family peptidyl-prolyl cis-trans isomerase